MKKFLIFALIPLILSIGISPAIPFSDAVESNQICIDKVWIENSKGKIACVTPSTADKLVQRGWGTILSDDTFEEKPTMKKPEIGQQIIETRVGTLELQSNYLTPETAKTLKDELFFQRAIQVYHLALPAVGGAGIFYDIDKVGAQSGDVIYWSDFLTSDIGLLTANLSVLYTLISLDLSDGPIVIDVPGGLYGVIDNIYQQPLVDVGRTGPDKGNGGLFLVLPPDYDDEIPDGYFIAQSDTMQGFFLGRSFVTNGDKSSAEDLIKKLNLYNLSEIDNPPKPKFIDFDGETLKMHHPTTEGFWEFLHKVYSKETILRPEDKNLIGLMHAIGIIPGQAFGPDEHSKKLLDEAAIVADLMTKGIAYDSPVKEPYIYYPDKNWELAFMTNNPRFEDERGATQIEPRLSFVYIAITTSEGMVMKTVGSGSKYLMNYRDANDDWLYGSSLYKLNVPANVPAENFWSIVVYDAGSSTILKNEVQPRPGINSLNAENYVQNDDGSYDVYFGPESPEGYESNWIKTNEGNGFFVMFRFYSPTEAYFDKSWQLPNIEKVN